MIEKQAFIPRDFKSNRKRRVRTMRSMSYSKPTLGYNPLKWNRKIKVIKGMGIQLPRVVAPKKKPILKIDPSKQLILEVKKPVRKTQTDTLIKKSPIVKGLLSKPSKKEIAKIEKQAQEIDKKERKVKKTSKLFRITVVVGVVGLIGVGIYTYIQTKDKT